MSRILDLEILPPAQGELEEIAQVHMALSGPSSARKITDQIFDALEQLTRFPLSGPRSFNLSPAVAGEFFCPRAKNLLTTALVYGKTLIVSYD